MIERILNQNFWYRNMAAFFRGARALKTAVAAANKFRRFRARRAKGPSSLVLFVTNRCQMACPFCFYQNSLNHGETGLSLNEITKLAESLKTVRRLNLTGGEPFLRADLPDICRAFRKSCRTSYINIPTNGMSTKSISEQVQKILKTTSVPNIKVQISIDALGPNHDQLRKTKNAFARATETLAELREIGKMHSRLTVEIAANANTLLMAEIEAFVSFFLPYKAPLKFSIIRDGGIVSPIGLSKYKTNPYHTEVAGRYLPTLEQLKAFYSSLIHLNENASYPFWSKTQQLKFKYSLDILEQRRRLFPCYAGLVEAVVYHTGDVGLCEYTEPIGNLRDHAFDFNRLWHSTDADLLRKSIQKCVCIHGCNLLTSMSYDDETLAAMI